MKRARTVGRQKQFYLLRGKMVVFVNGASFSVEASCWNDWDLTKLWREALKKKPPLLYIQMLQLHPVIFQGIDGFLRVFKHRFAVMVCQRFVFRTVSPPADAADVVFRCAVAAEFRSDRMTEAVKDVFRCKFQFRLFYARIHRFDKVTEPLGQRRGWLFPILL